MYRFNKICNIKYCCFLKVCIKFVENWKIYIKIYKIYGKILAMVEKERKYIKHYFHIFF